MITKIKGNKASEDPEVKKLSFLPIQLLKQNKTKNWWKKVFGKLNGKNTTLRHEKVKKPQKT